MGVKLTPIITPDRGNIERREVKKEEGTYALTMLE